jgi:hypothetical protein
MFSIAGTIGVARKNGQPFCFPIFKNYDAQERFGSKEDINIHEHLLNPLPGYVDLPYTEYPYFWGYRNLHLQTGNWNMNSHFQSEKYFRHCIDEIRHYFTFKNEPGRLDKVAIHYRAGDYDLNGEGYHPRCSFAYYEKAVQHFPSSKFILFSDNPDEAYALLKPLQLPLEVATGGYIEEFKLMKNCTNFVIANSSFSLMAAILATGEKKIVAPHRWFGAVAGLETADLYPENCIVL